MRFGLRLSLIALIALIGAAFVLGPTAVLAQSSAPPSFTPGRVALLASSTDPSVDAQLAKALVDPDPKVRMVAGRVIALGPRGALVNDLVSALLREQDGDAHGELTRDLLYIGGESALSVAEGQAHRMKGAAALAVAEWLGRRDPDRLARELPDLVGLANADALRPILVMAAWQNPSATDALTRAWTRAVGKQDAGELVPSEKGRPLPRTPSSGRTMPQVIPGLIESTLTAIGCELSGSQSVGVAEITFGPDGRPRHIGLVASSLSSPCQSALTALARLVVANKDYPAIGSDMFVALPFDPGFVSCTSVVPRPVNFKIQ